MGRPRPPRADALDEIMVPEGFLFLFCFDFLSGFERKNPTAVVEAFCRAFPPGSGPRLLIKSVNSSYAPHHFDVLRKAAADHPEIHLLFEIPRFQALKRRTLGLEG